MTKLRWGILLLVLVLAVTLPFASAGSVDMTLRCASPSARHLFGCDSLGRDVLGRVSYGVWVSVGVSVASALLSSSLGIVLAFLMTEDTWYGHGTRALTDVFKVLPPIVLGLFLAALEGQGVLRVIVAITLPASANVARTLSSRIKSLKGEDFVLAEKAMGISKVRIWICHLLPVLVPYLREHAASIAVSAVLTESSLSFLGLGVGADIPTLGGMLSEGRSLVLSCPHLVIFPSLFLVALGVGMLLVSRGLSELDSATH